jgi:hypothetical protein
MALGAFAFTTGPASLQDVGSLSYNNCVFSPLFTTNVSGKVMQDAAGRTTKCMEYTITADGYVTLPAGQDSITSNMLDLRRLLTAQGGVLQYLGRGMDIEVNPVRNEGNLARTVDVAWGPVPELLEFQPLGAGRSAKVQWQVKIRILDIPDLNRRGGAIGGILDNNLPLLQFNYETVVSYAEDGFSSLSIKGILEIPLSRTPRQNIRTLTTTVDDSRSAIESRIIGTIDLSRFRVTKRNFHVSRDKRTIEWDFAAEEKPYMDLPIYCMVARGTYNVRPARAGMGLCSWLCTLRATYTIRADYPRRFAWFAFLHLLRERMAESSNSVIPKKDGDQNPKKGAVKKAFHNAFGNLGTAFDIWKALFGQQDKKIEDGGEKKKRTSWLMDFSFDEGLYLDSKMMSFSATWRINTVFSHVLLASGLWVKVEEKNIKGGNLWKTSVEDVSGSESWLANKLDPKLDIIVDFGGG